MSTDAPLNRRRHARLRLNPMYTSVIVEPKFSVMMSMLGHAYDISESGMRIELDEPLEVGQRVRLNIELPGAASEFRADADVMWVNDVQDDPGPRRMAVRFTRFGSPADRLRLTGYLTGARSQIAA